MTVKLHALLKFGMEQHIVDLYRNGTLYFNAIENFRTVEDESLRGDKYEGNVWVSNIHKGDVYWVQDNGEEVYIGNADTHLRGYRESLKGNVLCMYAIHPGSLINGITYYDRRVLEFGSHFLAIEGKGIGIFLNRIWEQLKLKGMVNYGANLVQYYNAESDIFLPTSVFMKREEYSFQNEFRVFVPTESSEPFALSIGPLEDIATIHESNSLFR